MEIVAEDNGVLSKIIKIKIQPEDYKSKIESELKEYQKKSRIDGFRPGHVPLGLIKKKYGKALLYDAINKILPEKLQTYIEENKLNLIGEPLANKSDFDLNEVLESDAEMEFQFELGLEPEINLEQSFDEVIPRYLLDPSDEMIEDEIKHLIRKFGNHIQPEASETGDYLYGQFIELDENDNPKENGVSSFAALALDLIPHPDDRQKFIGLKKDEEIIFDLVNTIENQAEIANMLNIKKEQIPALSPKFKLNIKTVNRLIKAEVNQELFDVVFGPDAVKNEEEFKAKIKESLTHQYTEYSDQKLFKDVQEYLMKKLNPALPNDFIKRFLVYEYPETYTVDGVENDFQKIEISYQWNIIEKAIMRKYNIHVHMHELESVIANYMVKRYSEQGINLDDEQIDKLTKNYLENKEERKNLHNSIMDHKIFEAIRGFIKTEDKSLPMDEFTNVFKN
jgi:trigger factor